MEIDRPTRSEVLDQVRGAVTGGPPVAIAWVYAHCINVARAAPEYRAALDTFDLVLNDGAGIELAARALRRPVVENLAGTDLIPAFLDEVQSVAPETGVYLLGGRPEVSERAAVLVERRWPGLRLVGAHHGYGGDDDAVVSEIGESGAKVVIVAMGVPRQEQLVAAHRAQLEQGGVRLLVAGGAILDFLTGTVPRAPRWVRRARAEWVFRLVREPRRLWRRYIVGTVRFLGFVGLTVVRRRRDRPRPHS